MTEIPTPAVRSRKAATAFVLVTVTLDVLAMGLIGPVWPSLVRGFLGGDTQLAAIWFGAFATVFAAMQFICSPLLGALSDRFGRRPVILLSNFGLALDYLVMALAPTLGWLFVGRIVAGVTSAGYSTAYAYIADVTPAEKRAGAFGLIGAAFGLGFIIGPVLGGLLGQVDPRLPFWVAGGLSLLNGTYGLFVLPESLPPESRGRFSLARANPVGALKLLRSHPQLTGLASINFLAQLAHGVFQSVWVLYVAYRYHWSPLWVGISMAVVGVSSAVIQAAVVRLVVARVGERTALLIGLLCGATGFAIFGLADRGWMFLAGIPVMCLWGLTGPSVQGLMSRRVGVSEQGRLQGANSSVASIAGLFGPALFSAVFAAALAHREWNLPGAPFFVASAVLLTGMAAAWRVTARSNAAVQPAE